VPLNQINTNIIGLLLKHLGMLHLLQIEIFFQFSSLLFDDFTWKIFFKSFMGGSERIIQRITSKYELVYKFEQTRKFLKVPRLVKITLCSNIQSMCNLVILFLFWPQFLYHYFTFTKLNIDVTVNTTKRIFKIASQSSSIIFAPLRQLHTNIIDLLLKYLEYDTWTLNFLKG